MKKILLSPWLATVTLLLALAVRIVDPTFVESVRLRYFDTLITAQEPVSTGIYTVNIDEKSLEQYGQWPFDRRSYAHIIDTLYQHGAGLVVLNVLMPEPDRLGGDDALARAMQKYPVVLTNAAGQYSKNTPKNPGAVVLNPEYLDRIIGYPGIIANIPVLENSAAGVGSVHTLPEVDGVNRRIPLVVTANEKLYPSLGIETLRVAANDSTVQIKLNELGVEKIRIPKFSAISTDNYSRIWIDWRQWNISTSLSELPNDFHGAIVVVGPTAAGIGNPVPTSVGAVWPHELQGTVIGTMVHGINIQRPDWADGAEIAIIMLSALLLLFLTRWVYAGLGSVVTLIIASIWGSHFLYHNYLWLFDSTALVVTVIVVALHAYGVKFVSEFLQKQQIKKQFGTYLSPAMVEKLQKNPELLALGGESRELSIMFTDVRGFTSISEHYGKDVQGLTKIMNRYMTAMTAKIIENNGTLDKYIGDAQMAFWNAPLNEPNHAKMAVKTALEMLGSLDAFNKEVGCEGVPPFGMGIGINTDVVVVGNMGSTQRFDYTCLGDGVNLASRLEGQSKPFGVKIVIGSRTAEQVQDEYTVVELDTIAVKGKTEGVDVYTVLSQTEHNYNADLAKHQQMLAEYRLRNWCQARLLTHELVGAFGGQMDHYYELWLDRIAYLEQNDPGTGWDGVTKLTTK